MSGRKRMFQAITEGVSEEVPVVLPYIGIFLRDHWEEITTKPWWIQNSWDLKSRIRVIKDLEDKTDIDWISCFLCPPLVWRNSHKIKVVNGQAYLVGTYPPYQGSIEIIQRPPPGGIQDTPLRSFSTDTREDAYLSKPIIESERDIDKYITVLQADDLIESGMLDYAKETVKQFNPRRFIHAYASSPLWMAYSYFGFKGLIINLYRKPKLIRYLLEKISMRQKEMIKAFFLVGVDGIWITECLCSADVISLTHFKRFALPYTSELISEIRKYKMKSIYYHCGDVRDRLELLVAAEPDCISLEESKKNFTVNLEWVDKVVNGRTCIFGNLDSVNFLQNGAFKELEIELKRQIKIGRKYGRFVMSLGSPVTPLTSMSRVREYVDLTRKLSQQL